jgi:hypothetical protein
MRILSDQDLAFLGKFVGALVLKAGVICPADRLTDPQREVELEPVFLEGYHVIEAANWHINL